MNLQKGGNNMAENKCLFYDAKEVFEMLGLKESKGYTYLDKTMAAGKPFAVIRIDKQYRIPKESFDAWMKHVNQPIQN